MSGHATRRTRAKHINVAVELIFKVNNMDEEELSTLKEELKKSNINTDNLAVTINVFLETVTGARAIQCNRKYTLTDVLNGTDNNLDMFRIELLNLLNKYGIAKNDIAFGMNAFMNPLFAEPSFSGRGSKLVIECYKEFGKHQEGLEQKT